MKRTGKSSSVFCCIKTKQCGNKVKVDFIVLAALG